MSDEAEIRRFHGVLSQEYEFIKLAYPNYQEFQNAIVTPLISFISNQTSSLVEILEIGCGTGDTTKVIVSSVPYAVITAIDIEEAMISQAESKLAHCLEEKRIKFIRSDSLSYLSVLKSQQFDIVVSVFTFHNWEKSYRHKILREVFRVLKPAGLFICGDKIVPDDVALFHMLFQKQIYSIIEGFEKIDRWDLAKEWILHELEDMSPERILKESEWTNNINDAGFVDISYICRKGIDAVVLGYKP